MLQTFLLPRIFFHSCVTLENDVNINPNMNTYLEHQMVHKVLIRQQIEHHAEQLYSFPR